MKDSLAASHIASESATATFRVSKGRPPSSRQRKVAEDILLAVEQLAIEKGHFGMTEKEIASAAGTSEAMIHYYFKSRDRLLFCLIDKVAREFGEQLGRVEAELEHIDGDPTQFLVQQLMSVYSAQPAITRLVLSEFMRPQSLIKEEFLNHWGDRSAVVLRRILDRLVQRGLYRSTLNTSHAAFTLLCLINGPVMLAQLKSFDLQDGQRPWINHVVELLKNQFYAGPH